VEKQIENPVNSNEFTEHEVYTAQAERGWRRQGYRKIYALSGLLAVLVLIYFIWRGPLNNLWHDLFGGAPATMTSQKAYPEIQNDIAPVGSTANQNGVSHTVTNTDRQNTGSTTTNTTSGASPSDESNKQNSNLVSLYSSAKPGLTREQLIGLAGGQTPDSCTGISLENLTQQSVCTWNSAGKSVVITMQNGSSVGAPLKAGF
jgi:hypothetical protein